jgi:hypothetical protein
MVWKTATRFAATSKELRLGEAKVSPRFRRDLVSVFIAEFSRMELRCRGRKRTEIRVFNHWESYKHEISDEAAAKQPL